MRREHMGIDGTHNVSALIDASAERMEQYRADFDRLAEGKVRAAERLSASISRTADADRARVAEYQNLGMSPLIETLARDERYRRGKELFEQYSQELVHEEDVPPLGRVPEVDLEPQTAQLFRDDEQLDVFTKPYPASYGAPEGGDHVLNVACADHAEGRMAAWHKIGNEGGSARGDVGIWVDFAPHPGRVSCQVRPLCWNEYKWRLESYIAPAHTRGSVGIYVVSWDPAGGEERLEQDHRYQLWADGTSGLEPDHSPGYPEWQGAYAYLPAGYPAPYFRLQQGRLYSAAIWCEASSDAHGASLVQASYAEGGNSHDLRIVFIGQR
jgi:hypothetical protein